MKIDLHTHTTVGSGCAYMEPDQLVRQAKLADLDGVCITEHDQIWRPASIQRLRERHDFLVIGGVEVRTDIGEVLVFGLHQSVVAVYDIHDLKKMVDRAGGVMVLAHPFRSEPDLVAGFSADRPPAPDLVRYCDQPDFGLLDGVEVMNGRSGFNEKRLAEFLAERLKLGGTGGSDAHAILSVGTCYTVFPDHVRSEQDMIACIKSGQYHAVDARWRE